jgi:hypothetical protein
VYTPPVLTEQAGEPLHRVVHYHYVREGLHFVLVANTDREQAFSFDLRLALNGDVEEWDLETGAVRPCPVVNSDPLGMSLPVRLEPVQARLFAVDPAAACPSTPIIAADLPVELTSPRAVVALAPAAGAYSLTLAPRPGEQRVLTERVRSIPRAVELEDAWEFAPAALNALPLSSWQLEIENAVRGTDGSSNTVHLSSSFQVEELFAEPRLLLDSIITDLVWERSAHVPHALFVNGREVVPTRGDYLDRYMYEAPLEGLLQEGENRISLFSHAGLHEPANLSQLAYILGRFSVRGEKHLRLVSPVPTLTGRGWEKQGYPFYSGVGAYRQTFSLTSAQAGSRLFLELEAPGDLVEVVLNGQACGVRAWEPWRLEVSEAARAGRNELELRVANSMQNLIMAEPKPSGLLGRVRLVPHAELTYTW